MNRRDTDLDDLIERSSLGTDGASLLRQRAPRERVGSVVGAALGPDPADAAEFSAFYERVVPRLMRLLELEGASVSEAAACVQETMTRAFAQWSTIYGPNAWCRHEAFRLYELRRGSSEETVADTDTGDSSVWATFGERTNITMRPVGSAGRRDAARVWGGLSLSVHERQVAHLAAAGHSKREIAARLSIRIRTVERHLRNVHAKLGRTDRELKF